MRDKGRGKSTAKVSVKAGLEDRHIRAHDFPKASHC